MIKVYLIKTRIVMDNDGLVSSEVVSVKPVDMDTEEQDNENDEEGD